MKPRPAAEPMRMLGGSPMSVAVPPMFEAKICEIRYGQGETSSVRAIDSVTGVSSTTVVTLSRTAESTAVATASIDAAAGTAPRETGGRPTPATHSKKPVCRVAGQDHHPGQQEDDVEVDRGECLLLVDDPEEHDQEAAEKGHQGPVEPLRGDQGVGDGEDAACQQDVHVRTSGGRARARLRSVGVSVARGRRGDDRSCLSTRAVAGRHHQRRAPKGHVHLLACIHDGVKPTRSHRSGCGNAHHSSDH